MTSISVQPPFAAEVSVCRRADKGVRSTSAVRFTLLVGLFYYYSHVMEVSLVLYMELFRQSGEFGYCLVNYDNSMLFERATVPGKDLLDNVMQNQSYARKSLR
jgi:hypothetical protein